MSRPTHSDCSVRFVASFAALVMLAATAARAQSSGTTADGKGTSYFPDYAIKGPFDQSSSSSQGGVFTSAPLRVYFPPDPPPLDRLAKRASTNRSALGRAAPPELAAYVNEPFYPALAARLDNRALSDRQRAALAQYQQDKRALQHELRTELARLLALEPSARAPLLAALAQNQAAKISALEFRAEEFRTDFVKRSYAWSALREWHLGESLAAPDSAQDIARVMLAAAFFQDGPSPAQRTLLREIAIELPAIAATAEDAVAAQPYLFFSPGPARVLFPENISPAAGAKIADYQTRKSALRKTLYDLVFREDATWFNLSRTLRFKSLAEEQAPEFAALETLAEEIRRDLGTLPPPPRAESPVPLPPVLTQRVIAHFQRQTVVQRDYERQLADVRARHPSLRIFSVPEAGRRVYHVSGFGSQNYVEERDRAQQELDALAAANRRDLTALAAEQDALRRDLADFLHAEEPSLINVALNEGVRLAAEQDVALVANDYRLAVFEPGLSPGQRRLLFDAVVENSELPLPAGELQPTRRYTQRIGRLELR